MIVFSDFNLGFVKMVGTVQTSFKGPFLEIQTILKS